MGLAEYIDHTNLSPIATRDDIIRLCEEAAEHGFASVCVHACRLDQARKVLTGSDVRLCTVIGFPFGATPTRSKRDEVAAAIDRGATEFDMVLNIGRLMDQDLNYVEMDIAHVRERVDADCTLKVILETCYLTDGQIVNACHLAQRAGADFVKTSTGFGSGGATIEHIQLMRKAVGPNMGVKASGGIRDRATAIAMIKAGASRLGCSAGVAIVAG